MKKQTLIWLIGVLLTTTLGALAQKKNQGGDPNKRAERVTQQMATQLNLSAEQVKLLTPLNQEKINKQEEWRELLASGDRRQLMKERKDYLATYDAKLKGILSQQQYEQYQAQQKERQDSFKEKRKGRQE